MAGRRQRGGLKFLRTKVYRNVRLLLSFFHSVVAGKGVGKVARTGAIEIGDGDC